MDKISLENSALALEQARRNNQAIPPLTDREKGLDLVQAYKIQQLGIHQRVKDGDPIVGYKMGLTSKAKMEQMGLHTPIYGVLLKSMQVLANSEFSRKHRIHPKIEPEIAFVMAKELRGSVNRSQALEAIESVAPALEILDSRFRDFKYFSLPDVVADNSSSSDFLVGQPVRLKDFHGDLKEIRVTLEEDGQTVHEAYSNAALGDPVLSLCELVSLLWEHEKKPLPAGSIVLTGALTVAIPLKAQQKIRGTYSGLSDLTVRVLD